MLVPGAGSGMAGTGQTECPATVTKNGALLADRAGDFGTPAKRF
jgi:hypothetical protein